jgi:hypothetical protein
MNKIIATWHDTPTTFVLVHGECHGGWCWNKLTLVLRAAGHRVFTPTLTGLGERAFADAGDRSSDPHPGYRLGAGI